jgi:hypothetical protein
VKLRTKPLIIGLVALTSLSGFASIADVETQPTLPPLGFEIGKAFPPLAFPSLESGHPMSLADFRGEKVVLQIFASW